MKCGADGEPAQTPHFHPRHRRTRPRMTLQIRAWDRLNRMPIGDGGFRCCFHKWGVASFAACECGAEVQSVDHVVLQCPIH